MEDLKPCPFCGSKGRVTRTKDLSGYWYGECSKCYARQLAYSKDREEAVALWNTRAQLNTE